MIPNTAANGTPRQVALYALRRTLPSWCFDQRLAELLELCRDARIDEVIVKVDTEEFSHGIPTVPWLADYLPLLQRARDGLREIGVAFSINPWVTLGHIDRGRDLRETFPDFQWIVGHAGEQCRACACPISPGWQRHTAELWRMYASLNPRVIWFEDDLRSFNHVPARFGCFCELHLARMAEKVGRPVTRQEVAAAVLSPGQPHPWRRLWLGIQGEGLMEAARALEKAVHEVSPQTHLGLMSSGPESHCAELRDWRAHAGAIGGGQPIYSRPPLGAYSEASLRDLCFSAAQIKRTRHVLPPGTIEQTEVENIPFGPYAKSTSFTFLQVALSVAHGCAGATMNLYDHLGTPISTLHPQMQVMLHEARGYLEALADAHQPAGPFRGIRTLHHEEASATRRLAPGAEWSDLVCRDYAWETLLNFYSIATTYGDSRVVAADGQMIGACTDDQIRRMLGGGLLLDLVAAETLIDRGFGGDIGMAGIAARGRLGHSEAISAEELVDPDFAGAEQRYVSMTLPDLGGGAGFGRLELRPGARFISRLVDPDRRVLGGFTSVFENAAGGRVAVVPLELRSAMGPMMLHPYRRRQLLEVLRWLNRGELPASASGGAYGLTYRMDLADRIMLGLFNLDHDPWRGVRWETDIPAADVRAVEWLDDRGRWQPFGRATMSAESPELSLTLATTVDFRRPLVVALSLKRERRQP